MATEQLQVFVNKVIDPRILSNAGLCLKGNRFLFLVTEAILKNRLGITIMKCA